MIGAQPCDRILVSIGAYGLPRFGIEKPALPGITDPWYGLVKAGREHGALRGRCGSGWTVIAMIGSLAAGVLPGAGSTYRYRDGPVLYVYYNTACLWRHAWRTYPDNSRVFAGLGVCIFLSGAALMAFGVVCPWVDRIVSAIHRFAQFSNRPLLATLGLVCISIGFPMAYPLLKYIAGLAGIDLPEWQSHQIAS